MTKSMIALCLVVLSGACLCTAISGCGSGTPAPAGYLAVLVVDSVQGPVANQVIRITPGGATGQTNGAGEALFTLAPGDYFVDADVCCRGPGLIGYHVPVKVVARDTANVSLNACLTCE